MASVVRRREYAFYATQAEEKTLTVGLAKRKVNIAAFAPWAPSPSERKCFAAKRVVASGVRRPLVFIVGPSGADDKAQDRVLRQMLTLQGLPFVRHQVLQYTPDTSSTDVPGSYASLLTALESVTVKYSYLGEAVVGASTIFRVRKSQMERATALLLAA